MFSGCANLKQLIIDKFNTDMAENMVEMFAGISTPYIFVGEDWSTAHVNESV